MGKYILVGAAALCWAIWHCRNDICFDNKCYTSFMQAAFRGAYWLRFWALMQHEEVRGDFPSVSVMMDIIALELFASHR